MTAREEQERREREIIKPEQAICDIINDAFSEPFMPEGFVKAIAGVSRDDKPTISLHIGARDVRFTLDGEWIGQGTDLTSEWFSMTEDAIIISRMRAHPIVVLEET